MESEKHEDVQVHAEEQSLDSDDEAVGELRATPGYSSRALRVSLPMPIRKEFHSILAGSQRYSYSPGFTENQSSEKERPRKHESWYDPRTAQRLKLCKRGSLHSLKHDLLVKYLYQKQCSRMWNGDPSGAVEGVLLRHARGQYLACPEILIGSVLGRASVAMNLACVMTLNSREIRTLLTCFPKASDIPLFDGLRMQVLPSMEHFYRAKIAQNGAFVADRGILVVWEDDPWNLIQRCEMILSAAIELIWHRDQEFEATYKEHSTESLQSDLEAATSVTNDRPTNLANAVTVSLSLVVVIAMIGAGVRKLAIEVVTDHNYYRLAILALIPASIFFLLFFAQILINSIAQCIGPIRQMQTNSKFYSASTTCRLRGPLPHITIQCPVYKEGLKAVIQPTIQSVKAAITTYELHGGTANIFVNEDGMQVISEAERQARIEFYRNHNIGWTARPRHGDAGFLRRGKFKKASNMNFGLMLSCKVEEKLARFARSADWTEEAESAAYEQCLQEVLEELPHAWAQGNIRVGDYILLIDCDTRIPKDCLLDAVSEMECSPSVGILQFSSGVLQVVNTYFEDFITFFTNFAYTAIRFAVAQGDISPFVGHNAILRWSAVQQVGYVDEDGYEKFWSESHVSEDFDMSLRLQCEGYLIRLAAWAGEGFKEGVSLTIEDEVARWEKYAYGCNELLFHPIRKWIYKGPFTPILRRFLSAKIPFTSKVSIISYAGTYHAIGAGWLMLLINYFAIGWFYGYLDQYYMNSFKTWLTLIFVFNGLGSLALAVMRHRLAENHFLYSLLENIKWIPVLTIFINGLSLHVSSALLAHMLEIDMTWGATAKEAQVSNFFLEIPKVLKKFKWSIMFAVICIAGMVVLSSDLIPWEWRISQFIAIWPLSIMVGCHLLMPIALNPALMTFTF